MSVEILLSVCLHANCFTLKKDKIMEKMFMYAVKLIKRVAIQSCQAVDAKFILKVFDEHKLWNQYHNPYLTIDYPKKER